MWKKKQISIFFPMTTGSTAENTLKQRILSLKKQQQQQQETKEHLKQIVSLGQYIVTDVTQLHGNA